MSTFKERMENEYRLPIDEYRRGMEYIREAKAIRKNKVDVGDIEFISKHFERKGRGMVLAALLAMVVIWPICFVMEVILFLHPVNVAAVVGGAIWMLVGMWVFPEMSHFVALLSFLSGAFFSVMLLILIGGRDGS